MNKKLIFTIFLGMFLLAMLPMISASLLDTSTWDDKVTFHEVAKNGDYGYYEINDTTFWLFNNKPVKTIELLENDYSVFTAWNIKEIELFRNAKLYDKTNYLDIEQKQDKSNHMKSEIVTYRVWETKTRTINDGHCEKYETINSVNGTHEECSEWIDDSYEEEYKDWSDWQTYNFNTMPEGLYQVKTLVTRDNQRTGAIEWVDENEGHDLDKWATWWNESWLYKKEVTTLSASGDDLTNYPYYLSIDTSTLISEGKMNSSCKDMRFLNSAEDTELDFEIVEGCNSATTQVWVKIPSLLSDNSTTIFMYYGNQEVNDGQDTSGLWADYKMVWHGESVSSTKGNTFTNNNGATFGTGVFGNGVTAVKGSSQYLSQASSGFTNSDTSGTTMTSWLRDDGSFASFDTYIGKWNEDLTRDYAMYKVSSSQIATYQSISAGAGAGSGGVALTTPSSTYFHYSLLFNSSDTCTMVNAPLSWSCTGSAISGGTTNEFRIGSSQKLGGALRYGSIGADEVRYYNGVLSLEWLKMDHNQGVLTLYSFGGEQIRIGLTTNLIEPENNSNSTNFLINMTFESVPTDTNLTNATLYLWNETDNSLILTNFTTLSGNESINTTFLNSFEEGNYLWNAETCGEGVDCTFATSNNSFIIHLSAPDVIISEPTGTFDYLAPNQTLNLSWNIIEEGVNLSEHVITCSYGYNGNVTFLTVNTCLNVNTTTFNYVSGVNTLNFTVIDEFGLSYTNTTNWNFKVLQNSFTFQNSTIEGSTENFQLNFSTGGILQTSTVNLVYNGTSYPSTFLTTNGFVITNNDLSIPNVNTTVNNSFYWSIVLSDSSIINTSTFNQTVANLAIDNCGSFSNLIFNYTQLDEEFQTFIQNNSIEISVNIFDSEREGIVVYFSDTYNNTNPALVCINTILGVNTNYSVDSVVKYTSNQSSGYALEYFNLLNFTLANSTVPVNTNLYSLLEEDSTEFQLTFRDSNLALAPNILVSVNRQYVSDNDFKTVEQPVTDTNGQAVLHLVRNDIQYNFIMTDSQGNVVATFNKKNVFCQDFTIGSCTLNLNALFEEEAVHRELADVGITFTLSYSNVTEILSLEFLSLDLTPKEVRTLVTRDTDFGNRTVCDESLTSSSGIIACNVSVAADTDNFLFIDIFVDGLQKATETANLSSGNVGYGVTGYFIAFIFILLIITLFMDDRKTLVISLMIGWVTVISLGLLKGSLFGSVSAGVWLLVTIIIYIWKLSKEDSI